MKRFHSVSAWSVFKRKLKEKFRHLTDEDLIGLEADGPPTLGERMTILERLQRLAGRPAFEIARLAEEAAEESTPYFGRRVLSANEKLLGPIWLGVGVGASGHAGTSAA